MTTREALDQIDSLIAQLDTVCADRVWRVLTALRGPDAEGEEAERVKWVTTARIRAKAFPKTCARHGGFVVGYINDGTRWDVEHSPYEPPMSYDAVGVCCGPHFLNHYRRALGVLEP